MKECSKCKKMKTFGEFGVSKTTKNGYQSWCNSCKAKLRRDAVKTKFGLISDIYQNQRRNSIKRGHPLPSYTRDELYDWIVEDNKFDLLYRSWIESDCKKELRPSVDRIDDYKSYSLSNIQMMTWAKNSDKYKKDLVSGKNRKAVISVAQMDLLGNQINEFFSVAEASRVTGIRRQNILAVIHGRTQTSGGFKWKSIAFKNKTVDKD